MPKSDAIKILIAADAYRTTGERLDRAIDNLLASGDLATAIATQTELVEGEECEEEDRLRGEWDEKNEPDRFDNVL